jgi:hypothetical protein
VPQPVPEYHAERVPANALTPATRQALTTTIAAGVQTAIDAANTMSVLDLGVVSGGRAGDDPFKPDQADIGGGSPMAMRGLLESACQVGGYQRLDPSGVESRSAQLWDSDCAGSPGKQSGSPRNRPGVATMLSGIPDINGKWLQGTHGNVGRILGQVARQLGGSAVRLI